jgi:PAS domain-containing protein
MRLPPSVGLSRFLKPLWTLLGIKRKARQEVTSGKWNFEEIKDIDGVVETLNGLVARLCRDSSHLGELCAQAERRAARYALLGETVVDSVTSGIVVVDDTGEIKLVNAAAKRMFGIDPSWDPAGKRLAALLGDPAALQTLVAETFKKAANASRRKLEVSTRGGKNLLLGASTSCVSSSPTKVDAVIVVFTDLDEARGRDGDLARAETCHEGAFPSYLRGVLDCYDHFSAVVREVEKVQVKLEEGSLAAEDVTNCAAFTRRAWEIMSAFALSLVAGDSLCELTGVAEVIDSVISRRKELGDVKVSVSDRDLLRIRTVRKVFEAGLELLLLGCAADAGAGIAVSAGLEHEGRGDAVEIKVTENAPRGPVEAMGDSLRDFRKDKDLRREAGLMLLKRLSTASQRTILGDGEATLVVTLVFKTLLGKGAGPAAQRGDFSEHGPDGK